MFPATAIDSWSLGEICDLIIARYYNMGQKATSIFVGRSIHGCYHMSKMLKLARYIPPAHWTPAEVEFLIQNHPNLPYDQIAALLHRNKNEVSGKVFRLRQAGIIKYRKSSALSSEKARINAQKSHLSSSNRYKSRKNGAVIRPRKPSNLSGA